MGFELILNPLTKKFIRKAGPTHAKLVRNGLLDEDGKPPKVEDPKTIEVTADKIHLPKFKIIKN